MRHTDQWFFALPISRVTSSSLQAAVFNRVCRIYAPRYRQMQYAGFFADPATARPACDLAYSDVRAAFEHFLATRSGGDCDDEDEEAKAPRPIFLAAHSQGALHMARLLDDVVERRPALARNVVACYCIGMGLRRDSFEHHSRDDEDAEIFRLRPSSGPAQINALVSWNLRAAASSFGEANFVQTGVGPGHWSRARGGWYDDDAAVAGKGSALLQTSPLTWISNVGGGSVNDSGDAEDLTHLGVALPSFAPAFDPREMMNDEVFPSRLVALHRKKFGKRRPPYTATTTDYEVVVGNLSPSLSQMDMGQGVGDLHVRWLVCARSFCYPTIVLVWPCFAVVLCEQVLTLLSVILFFRSWTFRSSSST